MAMINNRYCAALLACSGLLSACGLWSNDSEDRRGETSTAGVGGGNGANTAGNGAGHSAGNGSGQSGAAGGNGSGGIGGGDACLPGIPVTSQIPRLLNREYAAVMRDLLGITTLASAGNQKLSELLVGDFDGPMSAPAWAVYQDVAEKIAHEVMAGPNRSKFISCDPAAAGCLDTTIESFGRKAFRRPLTDVDVARFQKLAQIAPAPTPDELAEATLFAFLVSPSFLMLPELTPDQNHATDHIPLSSYEVATRLSMLLWGSIPDDELNTAADKNQLQTKAQVLAQAQRMVQVHEKAAPLLAAFHQHWARMDDGSGHWWKGNHDTTMFPLYTESAKLALQAELDAFFDEIAFGHGTFQDYFLSNVAFVNRDNAAIYGLDPKKYGSELKRVELDAKARSGFLTRAGFLSSYSTYSSTSPFERGAFIALNLLGLQLGPPTPTAIAMTVSGDYKTNREYADALTRPSPCSGCHAIFNPLGFVLENYDAIGKWQTVDPRGGAIDATATVDLGNGRTKQIDSPVQLMQEIANSTNAKRLYAESWVSFAFGRASNVNDMCVVDQLASNLADANYELLSVLPELSQVDSFRVRAQAP